MFTKEQLTQIANESPTLRKILIDSFISMNSNIREEVISIVRNSTNKITSIKCIREYGNGSLMNAFPELIFHDKGFGTPSLKDAKELFEFVQEEII